MGDYLVRATAADAQIRAFAVTSRQLVEEGTIAAVICQQPKVQGSRPLDLLFTYLTTGQLPENEHHYVMTDIRIRENL